jgi:hypothetical protein
MNALYKFLHGMQTSQEPLKRFPADMKCLIGVYDFGDHEEKLFKKVFIHILAFQKSLVQSVQFFLFNLNDS